MGRRREKRKRREGENCETDLQSRRRLRRTEVKIGPPPRLGDKTREWHVMFWKIVGVFPSAHWLEASSVFSSIDFVQQR